MKIFKRPLFWVLMLILAIIVFVMARSLTDKGDMNNEDAPQQHAP